MHPISEKVLKQHIRTEKLSLKTGTSDDVSGKVFLQPSEVLDLSNAGNPHAKRNLLAKQKQVMANFVSPNKENTQFSSDIPLKKGQKTKAQTLAEQAESISKISVNYSESRKSKVRFFFSTKLILFSSRNSSKLCL